MYAQRHGYLFFDSYYDGYNLSRKATWHKTRPTRRLTRPSPPPPPAHAPSPRLALLPLRLRFPPLTLLSPASPAWARVQVTLLRHALQCCCRWALYVDSDAYLRMDGHRLSVEDWAARVGKRSTKKSPPFLLLDYVFVVECGVELAPGRADGECAPVRSSAPPTATPGQPATLTSQPAPATCWQQQQQQQQQAQAQAQQKPQQEDAQENESQEAAVKLGNSQETNSSTAAPSASRRLLQTPVPSAAPDADSAAAGNQPSASSQKAGLPAGGKEKVPFMVVPRNGDGQQGYDGEPQHLFHPDSDSLNAGVILMSHSNDSFQVTYLLPHSLQPFRSAVPYRASPSLPFGDVSNPPSAAAVLTNPPFSFTTWQFLQEWYDAILPEFGDQRPMNLVAQRWREQVVVLPYLEMTGPQGAMIRHVWHTLGKEVRDRELQKALLGLIVQQQFEKEQG
ncbi:unnamed protein product [Closterium sp. Naga37s-1]|nr:unnamed protein product [Closterium sp. Naga37s-1]